MFPLYFFCFLSHNHVYHQSTYYRNKYFWNVKNGFWIIQVCIFISFNSELFFKKVIYGLSENFFLDFSNSVPAQKILITTRFFCLIMLHLIVNCKNHHSEVCHLSKKIIKWVFLWMQGSMDHQIAPYFLILLFPTKPMMLDSTRWVSTAVKSLTSR